MNPVPASEEASRLAGGEGELALLAAALRRLNRVPDVAAILRSVLEGGMELVDARAGAWGIYEPDGSIRVTEYVRDGKRIAVDRRFGAADGVPGLVTRTRRPYRSNDVDNDPWVLADLAREFGFYNLINLPVLDPDGRLVGYVAIHNKRDRLPFDDHDVALLEIVATAAGGAIANARSLQERDQALEELRTSVEKFRGIFEASLDAIAINDEASGRYLEVNGPFLELAGYPREKLIGRTPVELGIWMRKEDFRTVLRSIAEKGSISNLEANFRMDGGHVITGLFSAVRVVLQGRPCIVSFVRDVTRQKQLEAQLRQGQKIEALGRLAASIAHEINNPLTFVLDHLETLRAGLVPLGPPVDRDQLGRAAREAWEGANRVRRIVRDLKTFARSETREQHVPVDVGTALRKALQIARNEIRYRARLVTQIPAGLYVIGDDLQLSQVFLNLIVNAAQAVAEGHIEENEICVSARADGEEIVVEVSDTGAGIAPEHLDHLFDPFFTTKPVGEGTGLGLSICHRIVEALGGRIDVESEVGKGTRFTIGLPAVAAPAATAEGIPAPARAPAPRHGRILVIDDERLVRQAAARILRPDHEVVEAANGGEALAILEGDTCFDLIFCDLMMANVSGMELHEILAERSPALAERMVFMTGGAFTPAAQDFLHKPGIRCLEKPFSPDEFRNVANQLIPL